MVKKGVFVMHGLAKFEVDAEVCFPKIRKREHISFFFCKWLLHPYNIFFIVDNVFYIVTFDCRADYYEGPDLFNVYYFIL